MVGGSTWRADDPLLTVRDVPLRREKAPARVLVDTRGELPLTARVFADPDPPVWVATTPGHRDEVAKRLAGRATVLSVAPGSHGLDPASLVEAVGNQGARTILCEGGGALVGSLLTRGLLDRLYLFVAPVLLGEGRVPGFPSREVPEFGNGGSMSPTWRRVGEPQQLGEDIVMTMDRSA